MKKTAVPNELLRQARQERNWTQRHLADELGVEEQTVRSWERGKRLPSMEFRGRLCDIYSKTPAQLGLLPAAGVEVVSHEPSLPPAPPVDQTNPFLPVAGAVDPLPLRQVPSLSINWTGENRHRMLKRVRSRWIKGILEHSLHRAALIVLGLGEQPDAVENPWHLAIQESNLPPHPLPPGTRITHVYDEANGELLMLGEPGAGKTTLLLELARDLLVRAERDPAHPMPVVFNLSSWAVKRQPLAQWLVEELNAKYQVPRKVGQAWINTDQLLLLLDGLDEVAQAQRSACLDAINRYHEEHHLVPIVVCSREAEYQAQAKRIALQRAVVVQPLTPQQIDEYLSSAGESLVAVREVLRADPALQELAATPLMLSVLTLAYHGKPVEDLPVAGSPEAQRSQVFTTYVQRVLARRGAETRYSPQQTTRWLAWLAWQLSRHSQTEFYIERMQPDWIADGRSRQHYPRTIVRLIFGIQIFISAGLFSWLRGGFKGNVFGVGAGLLGALGSGPGNRILGWMAPGLGGGLEGGGSLGIIIGLVTELVILLVGAPLPTPSVQALWRGLSNGLSNGLKIGGIVGVFAGLIFGLSGGFRNGLYRGTGTGLFSGLLIGLMTGLTAGLRYEQDSLGERHVKPDQEQSRSGVGPIDRLLDVLIYGFSAGLAFGGVYGLLVGVNQLVVIYGAIVGFFYGVAFGLGGGTDLIRGLGTDIKPAETVAWSWRSVGQHLAGNLREGLIVGIAVTVPVTVVIGCASGLFYGVRYGLAYGLVFGPIIGLVGGVAGTFTSMLNSGWSSNVLAERLLVRPNEGIRRSLSNAVFAACLFGPVGGLASGLVCGLAFGFIGGLAGWPILGVGFAIAFGIIFALQFVTIHGGIAYLEHYILRWYLWRAGYMPWNYVAFLDFAAERILLSKVGGGYIFSHHLLLDYFAALDTTSASGEKKPRPRSSASG
jgi:transcriptional regulator with XRE-family HTH domain